MTIHEMVNFLSTRLKEDMEMNAKFPFDTKTPKEDRRKPHMKDLALKPNVTYILSPEMHYFELGNENAERQTPHYHILEDAKIIRNPYKGTKKTLGSQRTIKDRSKRDYGQFVITQPSGGGYRITQEYRQNILRNYDGTLKAKTQPREYRKRQKVSDINKRNYRYNKHWQYIERILFDVTKGLAIETGTRLRIGTSKTDDEAPAGFLNSDYQLQTGQLTDRNGNLISMNLEGID